MIINRQGIIAIGFSILLFSCGSKPGSSTTFTDDKLLDNYSIKIPSVLNKEREGKWSTSESDKNLLLLEINTSLMDNKSLQQHLDLLVNEDKRDVYQDKSFMRKDSLSFNGFTGIAAYYNKNNNKGLIPVVTYFTFAILQDGSDIIKISSVSYGKDYTEDIITSIKSIKTLKNDSLKTSTSKEPKKEISKQDLKKLKAEGFKIFERENFAIRCPADLKLNTALIKEQKAQGNPFVIYSYQGAINPNNPNTAVMYGIDVIDLSIEYNKLPASQHNQYTVNYLKYYANKFSSRFTTDEKQLGMINGTVTQSNKVAEYTYAKDKFNSIDYCYMQATQPFPCKAIFFIKDKKIYTLMVGGNNDLDKKFNVFKKSFKFLK